MTMTNYKLSIAWCGLFVVGMGISLFSYMVLNSEVGFDFGTFLAAVVIITSCPICIIDALLTRKKKKEEKEEQKPQDYAVQPQKDLDLERQKIELEKEKLRYQKLKQQSEKGEQPNKKYCTYCGKEVGIDAKICTYCGAELD